MHKLLMILAWAVLSFGAFLASCAMQTTPATKTPAASTHKKANGKSLVLLQVKRSRTDRPFAATS